MFDRSCGSRSALRHKFPWTSGVPDAAAALASYRELAPHYDVRCLRIAAVREYALGILDARPGETIVDVACGSGAMLPALAARVGSRGRVIGIEQSPEMLALARRRFAYGRLPANVELVADPAERARLLPGVAAFVFSYAHDVLQSPVALRNVLAAGTPGARVVVCGMRLLPWWYAAPANIWCTWRARHFLSTFRGLRRPWSALREHCADFALVCTFHAGMSFVAVGRLGGAGVGRARRDDADVLKQSGDARVSRGHAEEENLCDAIREGVVLRVRPKAMPVAVITAGLLPIPEAPAMPPYSPHIANKC